MVCEPRIYGWRAIVTLAQAEAYATEELLFFWPFAEVPRIR
jgi:hypothetical protein